MLIKNIKARRNNIQRLINATNAILYDILLLSRVNLKYSYNKI